MARFVDRWSSRDRVDALVDRWKEECLVGDGSLLSEDRPLWTSGNLESFLETFVDREEYRQAGLDFEGKVNRQFEGADEDTRLLASELAVVHFLFVREAVSSDRKREVVGWFAGDFDLQATEGWDEVSRALDEGIGHPGRGFSQNRDQQLRYLADFCIRIKALDPEQRRAVMDSREALISHANGAPEDLANKEMRHVLLHLLRPDEFERMASGSHKQRVVEAFGVELLGEENVPEDVDDALYLIRQELLKWDPQRDVLGEGELDFFYSPLQEIWGFGTSLEAEEDLPLLKHKKQMILYGPPGTGKTHRVRELASSLIRQSALDKWGASRFFSTEDLEEQIAERIEWRQLHPGYGYEEFVRGMQIAPDGSTQYVDGLLPRLVERIESEPEEERLPTVLVLDEINRTDLSRMLGEAFSLLENRYQSVDLAGINEDGQVATLRLPSDLYVIGTMNLIDQSVEEIDFALKRRFFWRPAGFQKDPIVTVAKERWTKSDPRWGWDRAVGDFERLADRAEAMNRQIADSPHLGEQYEVGHTYFFDAVELALEDLRFSLSFTGGPLWTSAGNPRVGLENLWKFSIGPLLETYLEGVGPTEARQEWERLRGVLLNRDG